MKYWKTFRRVFRALEQYPLSQSFVNLTLHIWSVPTSCPSNILGPSNYWTYLVVKVLCSFKVGPSPSKNVLFASMIATQK